MAEATGLRNNALPYPVYGAPFGVVFPIHDNDGDLVTGAAGLDSEISKNGDTAADCTNEATEIATSTGHYYLLLTATEMTADVVSIRVKTSTSDAKTTSLILYPRKLVAIRAGTAAGGASGSITLDSGASAVDDFYNGCLVVGVLDSNTEARIITDYVGSTKVASVTPNWVTTPDSDDTFTIYLPEGVQLNQANVTHISQTAQTARDLGASVLLSPGTGTGQISLSSGAVTAGTVNDKTGYGLADGAITAAKIAADAITAAKLHSDVTTEIQSGLATASALATAQADLDTLTGSDGATLATSQPNYAPSKAGDAMALVNDAITAAKFDESTAFPVTAADTGSTQIARTGADADTLETLSDQLDAKSSQASVDDLPTNAELASALGGLENLSQAEAEAAAAAALADIHLDHLLAQPYDAQAKPGDADALLNAVVESDDASPALPRFTAGALEEAPTGGSAPTVGQIADAVWEEAIADHEGTAGSVAEALADAGGSGASASDIADAVWDEATSGHTTGGTFGAQAKTVLDARASQTSVDDLPTNAELTSALAGSDDAVLAAIAALENLSQADVIAAILDEADTIETGLTVRGALRLALAALAGKLSGANTNTSTFRNAVADTKNRIVATTDATGRTAMTTDAS